MNIYVDGMFFRLSGIGRIYENVLMALLEDEAVENVSTIVPSSRSYEFLSTFSSPRLDVRFVPYEQGSIEDFSIKTIQIKQFKPRPDLYYFPNFYFPVNLRGKIIVNVNDLIPLYPFFDLPKWKKMIVQLLISRSLKKAYSCVCISKFTCEELLRVFSCDEAKLEIIYPWLDKKYKDDKLIHELGRETHMVEGEYILFVGNRFIHKNLRTLICAYKLLVEDFPSLRLVIAGARMRPRDDVDREIEMNKLENKVVQMESLSDNQIMNLYRNCLVFVFPSLTEGFGLPPLEAMALGAPVVCSDIPVLREVIGNAALYADPKDPMSFARMIKNIILDQKIVESLRQTGIERVAMYNRKDSMEMYVRLFKKAIS